MEPIIPSGIETPVMATRYMSGTSVVFYDRFIRFDEEMIDVWSNLRDRMWLKLLFLCGRHITEVYLIYTTIVTGGFLSNLSQKDCQAFVVTSTLFLKLAVVGTEGVVIYRLRSLWDHSRRITFAIGAMALIVLVTMVVTAVLEITRFLGKVTIASFLKSPLCLFPGEEAVSALVLEGAVLMAWDVFNFLAFTTNTFAKPYRCSYDVFSRFKRDGGRYFICLFVVRSLYFWMSIFGGDLRFSALPLSWGFAAIINARIFHRIGRDFESKPETLD